MVGAQRAETRTAKRERGTSRTRRASWLDRRKRRAQRRRGALLLAAAALAAVAVTVAGPAVPARAIIVTGPQITVTPSVTYLPDLKTFEVTTNINADEVEATVGVEFGSSDTLVGKLGDESNRLAGTFPATGAVCGENAVTLVDESEEGDPTVGEPMDIDALCPVVALNPNSVAFTSEPATVTVVGRGFVDNQPLQVSIDGKPVGQDVTSDGDGLVNVQLPVSGLLCTPHTVTVASIPPATATNPAGSASAPLTITGCPPLTLKANPDVVTENSVTEVTGTGFVPNQPVTLSWQLASGTAVPGFTTTTTTDASGDIDAELVVLLPGVLGPCDVVATQGTTKALAAVVDQVGSMEPSNDDQLVTRQ